jgi:DNA-binding transcriptional ArsR family regulator
MKPASEGLATALAQLEASFRKRGPREEQADGKAVDLGRERRRREAQDAAELVRLALKIGLERFEPGTVDALERVAHIFAEPKNDWTFVMLSPAQNATVVKWLAENSSRPIAAMKLWATLFGHLRMDTGEIMLPRARLAETISVAPKHLSSIMTELEGINAIRRERDGRRVRYFMNANVATHATGPIRDEAQKSAGPLTLVQGGRVDG